MDGSTKMSKSGGEGNSIFLNEEEDSIRKKIMKAKTDGGPTEMNQAKPQEIQNIFALMKIVSTDDTLNHFENTYNNCTIRYGDMKKQLAEDMIKYISPIREKINTLLKDEAYLASVVKRGGEEAKENAEKTINEVRKIMGINYF